MGDCGVLVEVFYPNFLKVSQQKAAISSSLEGEEPFWFCTPVRIQTMCLLSFSDLENLFSRIDLNNDGLVSVDELTQLLDKVGVYITAAELEEIVGKTTFNLEEFIAFYKSISSVQVEEESTDNEEKYLFEAFKVFDLNNDGFISCEELQIVLLRFGLLQESNDGDCIKMICSFDLNSDGKLDFEEFKHMMFLNGSQ